MNKKENKLSVVNFIIEGKERVWDKVFEKDGVESTIINIALNDNYSVGFNPSWVHPINDNEVSVGIVNEWDYNLYSKKDKAGKKVSGVKLVEYCNKLNIPLQEKRVQTSSVFSKLI